jgi:hypothetical protein
LNDWLAMGLLCLAAGLNLAWVVLALVRFAQPNRSRLFSIWGLAINLVVISGCCFLLFLGFLVA